MFRAGFLELARVMAMSTQLDPKRSLNWLPAANDHARRLTKAR
jgi:hypothetical protein